MNGLEIKIVYQWVKGDCIAKFAYSPEIQSKGRNPEEVIGRLVLAHQEKMGFSIEEIPNKV